MSSATKYVPPDPKSYSLPQSVVSCPRSHAQENRTAELNKAIISLTCRQFNSKSCSAMPLSKLREEGCGASEAPGGAITHKIKLNVIIELEKRALCAFARAHSAFFIYSILSLYVNIKQGTKNKMFLCLGVLFIL